MHSKVVLLSHWITGEGFLLLWVVNRNWTSAETLWFYTLCETNYSVWVTTGLSGVSCALIRFSAWHLWNLDMPPSALPKGSRWIRATFWFLGSNSVSLLLMRYLNRRLTTSSNVKAAFVRSFSSHSVLSNPISDGFTLYLASWSGVVVTFDVLPWGMDEPLLLDMKLL